MTRFLFAAAAASLTFAAPALASERSFTRDGVTYTYSTAAKDGTLVLEGTSSQNGKFRLVVKNGWVSGYAGPTRVSFRAPKSLDTKVEVAQR